MSYMYKFDTPDGGVAVIDMKDILKLKNVGDDTEVTLKNESKIVITGMWRFYSDSMSVLHLVRDEPSYYEQDENLSKRLFLGGLFSSHCAQCKHTSKPRTEKPCSKCYHSK